MPQDDQKDIWKEKAIEEAKIKARSIPRVEWIGASQNKYTYLIYPLPFICNPNQAGNYIFTKVVDNVWRPVYFGEGELNERCNDETHYQCAVGKGATHVHIHLNPVQEDRCNEEADLLAGHPSAYIPTGCNEKKGG